MSFDHITINQGLSNNTIYSIVEDQDGFLWFGSRDGLHRYDGYEFKSFKSDPEDSLSLPSNNVQSLFLHPNGDIWIGLKVGGLCIFGRQSQRLQVNPLKELSFADWREVSIQSIFQDSYGEYWIGTAGHGVIRMDSSLQRITHYSLFEQGHPNNIFSYFCFSFVEDAEGNIWMGTEGNRIPYFERKSGAIKELSAIGGPKMKYTFTKSLLFVDGTLWIGTEGDGLYIYDPKKKEFILKALNNSLIKDMARDSIGRVLISTDGDGLIITEDQGHSFQNIRFSPTLANSLNTNALYDLFVDSNNNIWIGSFNGGVNVHKPNKASFLTYLQSTSITDAPGYQSVLTFCEDTQGYIWIGKDGGGLVRFNPASESQTSYQHSPDDPNSISSNVVTSLYEDRKGNLWVGTFANGLNRFDRSRNTFEHFRYDPSNPLSLSNDNVWAIAERKDGSLWIGTLGGGLEKFDYASKRFYHYQPVPGDPSSLSGLNVQVLLVDKDDNLWVGTEYGGLNKLISEEKGFRSWKKNKADSTSLRVNSVLCLHQDRNGRIWVGTEGGGLHLLVEDEQSFRNYSVKDGLPSNVVNAIEEDDNGVLWISTNMGLSAFNPSTGKFTNYDKNDGLQSNQFNRSASLRSSSGDMYFGGIHGVNAFHPEKVHINGNLPKVVFTDFMLFNQPVPVGLFKRREVLPKPLNEEPTITLRYSDNVFSIEFAAIEFTNPSKNMYAYRLEGFEEDWTIVDATHRRATYTNLDAGEYTFRVKAGNNSGLWNAEPRTLKIIVTPPFWETWWFRLLLALAILALFIVYIRIKDDTRKREHQKQLMEAEQEILKLKNEKLGREIKEKNAQLAAALLQTAHKNTSLSGLKHELAELSQYQNGDTDRKREIRQLIHKIDSELDSEDYWEQFQLNFDQVHQQFSTRLHQQHPQLSSNDIRLCCLIKINMTNKEIASIQNISVGAVEKSKYRLKKKLALEKEEDLHAYILGLS
ncbi:MAG: hypothetical protein KDD19_01965 [Phaeodactylibacter sp.]|nr:hypothetical protein [Phaeodactylibacter sp.]MCB9051921.1 hypothetical protein [Lewinellaceae bacterium]